MGVKGLWSLLNPVARPVQIESMEGKRLAIDSSIWLYQFQATMRDKDGRVLVNAHVLGFLRRINKLLFHGIKPVFVFDGGAPVLKRNTIAERKRRKAGAAANHARMAERLFAAQMRREAVKAAQSSRDQQVARDEEASRNAAARYNDEEGDQIDANAVYLEELEGRPGPSRPRVEAVRPPPPAKNNSASEPPTDPREERRKKFKKHDPYRLPEATIPTVSTEDKPDARLATEEELKQFIDEVHPEDIDVESPEFRALPTEVQYEIIGDLRVRSRQQSHRRLADMLRQAPSALDFSMAQIKHLSQRNALTQQLLTVTDMVGKAHLTIPVRIAAERNREYVLVKRGEDEGGGWALGIREGSKQKPIEVEPDQQEDEDSEEDSASDSGYEDEVEEVQPPATAATAKVDSDLKELRRREILEAIAARYAPKKAAKRPLDVDIKEFGKKRAPGAAPLFEADEEEEEFIVPTANDEALALALQQEELGSDEEEADRDLARALALSRKEAERSDRPQVRETSREKNSRAMPMRNGDDAKSEASDESFEEVDLVPSGLNTPQEISQTQTPAEEEEEEDDFIEVEPWLQPATLPKAKPKQATMDPQLPRLPLPTRSTSAVLDKVDDRLRKEQSKATRPASFASSVEQQAVASPPMVRQQQASPSERVDDEIVAINPPQTGAKFGDVAPISTPTGEAGRVTPSTMPLPHASHKSASTVKSVDTSISTSANGLRPSNVSDRPVRPSPVHQLSKVSSTSLPSPLPLSRTPSLQPNTSTTTKQEEGDALALALLGVRAARPVDRHSAAEMSEESYHGSAYGDVEEPEDLEDEPSRELDEDDEDEEHIQWSRSASPVSRPPLHPAQSGETIPSDVEDADEDMAPADMVVEEDDYARFLASIKNRDLNEVRTEIDDEIRVLNAQNKLAMRDSDEITQAMISQIQTLLRHFGIPYITAPMEAEAQCAKLAELNLVDGIITDDSDVFLFGGKQCFKNIFNDAKYAECFVLSDVDRELSLTRERLISLAFLLGSDYTIGLPGVGPVVALELLANFPGPRGLDEFKAWWTRVQRGQDDESDTNTKWKKSFKKRFAPTILLTSDWPNPLVREAYLYPTTDESEEPFHWGFPKLSALRSFLHEELSWSISKVDDELTPIVQRIARRGKVGALNKQATLDPFFDVSAGHGNYAPRRRTTANVSKRLMAVIKQYREAEARVRGFDPEWQEMMVGLDEEDPKGRGTGKRRKVARDEDMHMAGEGEDDEWKNGDGLSVGDGPGDEDEGKKQKKRRVSRKKSDQVVGESQGDVSVNGEDEQVGEDKPVTVKKPRQRRVRRDTTSSVATSEYAIDPSEKRELEDSLPTAEVLVPKNGLRGSSTGMVRAGIRKKAAVTAWRNSTKSRDMAPG